MTMWKEIIAGIKEENLWLESLEGVVGNDVTATQNWYIPLYLLEWVGFDMEETVETMDSLGYGKSMYDEESVNEKKNKILVDWINARLKYNEERIMSLRE